MLLSPFGIRVAQHNPIGIQHVRFLQTPAHKSPGEPEIVARHNAPNDNGMKARVTEQHGWRPESSIIVQGHTPTSGPDPATAFSLGYVVGWELTDEWKLDSAIRLGADKEKDDRFETWSPSIVLRKTLAERWNIHAEYFGHFSQDRTDNFAKHFVSPGVHYLITPNIEIGVRVGWGLNDEAARFFSNVGIGWRF